ncbi:spermatogenesis-associated protein 1 isoform X2 [Lingula anatina]|uniref:Spermatogenesis-associated protein 1 isoform X2 n=1 Tax=Lingula anatina TaxID=7574 RepID=A0A1S3HVI7_LINAN|nr:spermatogenesis-associated protein 1 isoform X2 [Lingula anatina]|eukprot:XP_013390050.1 spermatogenesis-associated protein 1 isoform X2 [Lingula anatina]
MRNHGQEDSMRNSKMSRGGEYPERSPSEQLVDLHVYVMPPDLWRENKNNAVNEVISEMSSAGFIRVHPQQKIYELRSEIEVQLGGNNVPKEYVFLKSVGRCLTRVRPKQEVELKAKNFVPPQAYLPEIFVLEATPELRELFKNDSPRTVTNHRSPGSSQQSPYFQRTQNGYNAREMSYNDTAKYDGNTYGHGRRGHSFETAENGLYPGHSQRQGAISSHATQTEHDAHITGKDGRGKGHSQSPDTRSANTHTTNGDSGIADGTPDREFRRDRTRDTLDRRKNDSGHGGGSHLDGTSEGTREDRQKQEDPSHGWVEEERRRLESKERHRLERKGGDSQEQGSEEEAWSQDNAEGLDSGSPNSLSRFPSPPPLTLESINSADSNLRESSSARERRQQEKEKLLAELEVAREERKEVERKREELVKKAKQLQHKTNNRRNQARDIWKKKYFEEKKKTPPLEDQCNKLRHEIEVLHRRLMSQLEGTKDARHDGKAPGLPSQKNNYKIQATRLHHETEELRRKVENAKMKLTAEMKLRNQAETELRALRAELTQKKINVTLTRSQQMAALGSSHDVFSPRTPVATPR